MKAVVVAMLRGGGRGVCCGRMNIHTLRFTKSLPSDLDELMTSLTRRSKVGGGGVQRTNCSRKQACCLLQVGESCKHFPSLLQVIAGLQASQATRERGPLLGICQAVELQWSKLADGLQRLCKIDAKADAGSTARTSTAAVGDGT